MTPVEIPSNQKKIMFPRVANYSGVIRYFIEVCMGQKYIMPPKMTRHTLEVGARYSPDTVCTPFKSTLGCMIEALDLGAGRFPEGHPALPHHDHQTRRNRTELRRIFEYG